MIEGPEIAACGCSNYRNKVGTVRKPAKKPKTETIKVEEQKSDEVQYSTSSDKTTHKAVKTPPKKTYKKTPDEPYKDVLPYPGKG